MSELASLGEIISGFGIPRIVKKTPEDYAKSQCERENAIVGNLNDGYNCTKCNNRGYTHYVKDTEVVMRVCECMRSREAIRNMKRSGLESVIHEYTFENYITSAEWQTELKAKALKYCSETENKWFYLGGQSGIGKSHLCTAIAISFLRQGKSVRYMKWVDDTMKLKASMNTNEYSDIINGFKETDVLYIDDFLKTAQGKEPTAFDMMIAFEIINYRYNAKKPTIISTEFLIDDTLRFDEATMARVYQISKGYCLNIPLDTNKNYRLRGVDKCSQE